MKHSELAFRNIDMSPAEPVASWPVEAFIAALERGSLRDWARISDAVWCNPWGPAARSLENALAAVQPYGVAAGMVRALAAARVSRERAEKDAVAVELRALLASSALTATEFASRLGTSASRLSTYLSGKVTPSAALVVRARRITSELNLDD